MPYILEYVSKFEFGDLFNSQYIVVIMFLLKFLLDSKHKAFSWSVNVQMFIVLHFKYIWYINANFIKWRASVAASSK